MIRDEITPPWSENILERMYNCRNWHTLFSKSIGGSHFCSVFAFIPHCHDSFAGIHYRVLASFQSWKLRLCGYQCSTCMHPCLHAIGMCPYPFLCQDCGTETFPTSYWSPYGSITACGFSCMTFSWFHRRSFMPEFQCHCQTHKFINSSPPWRSELSSYFICNLN